MITLIDHEVAQDTSKSEDDYRFRIAPGEFMRRAVAAFTSEPDMYPSKLAALRKMLTDAATACKLAKKQGDPTDNKVQDHILRHGRRSSSLILPGSPGLPPMPGQRMRIKPNGEVRDILSKGYQVTPDLVLSPGVPRR
jgi:hypothetical protein